AEDAVLAMSGYNANTGLMQAFAGKDVVVYLDHRAHASLWEGVSAARARAIPFRHNDAGDLARKIRHFGPGIVAVDALYSTDGHVAPLVDIVAAAEAGGCAIIVDETHSFGCQGPGGAGIVVELGLEDRVHFRTVGLSKAVAARGGMVVGSACNMEFFRYEAFPMIFSTSVLGYEIAGFDKTLDIIRDEPWRREQLAVNQRFLRDGLADVGYDVTRSDRQIVAIITGGFEDTVFFREALAKRGIFGSVFCPPATPKGASLIRFTLNCSLTATDLDRTIAACDDIRRKGSTIGLASRARVRSVPGGTTRNGPESRSN
ncbi:MAG TPA: aminotransferase class I/II-fold pyridoxal phosphate-dependent enzyme, partial [Hyphomicrobiales bacterium]|nr:aminotransferase class I/II-fold pyridoxal phosphate-dependent enzyme [Hyphomicrobiales bacterium]